MAAGIEVERLPEACLNHAVARLGGQAGGCRNQREASRRETVVRHRAQLDAGGGHGEAGAAGADHDGLQRADAPARPDRVVQRNAGGDRDDQPNARLRGLDDAVRGAPRLRHRHASPGARGRDGCGIGREHRKAAGVGICAGRGDPPGDVRAVALHRVRPAAAFLALDPLKEYRRARNHAGAAPLRATASSAASRSGSTWAAA